MVACGALPDFFVRNVHVYLTTSQPAHAFIPSALSGF